MGDDWSCKSGGRGTAAVAIGGLGLCLLRGRVGTFSDNVGVMGCATNIAVPFQNLFCSDFGRVGKELVIF